MITIRDARPGDYIKIREVQKASWLNTYPDEKLGIKREDLESKFERRFEREKGRETKIEENLLNHPDTRHLWIVEHDGKMVGFCDAQKKDAHYEINAIYLSPEFQGQGAGARLLKKATEWLGKDKEISISVASYNDKAIAFYNKFGFNETGREKESCLTKWASIPVIEMVKKGNERG